MSENSELWYLQNVNLFQFLCPNKLKGETDSHDSKEFQKGEYIQFPQQSSTDIFLIEKGSVKICSVTEDGKEILKSILYSGEIFGELAILEEGAGKRDFSMAMENETLVCRLTGDSIRTLLKEDSNFSIQIIRLLGMRVRKLESKLESLMFKDARTRIVDFIREFAEEKGTAVGDEMLVKKFLTHKDIASLTGTSRQTVTSVLNDLRDKNKIYFDRKRLLVRDIKNLC